MNTIKVNGKSVIPSKIVCVGRNYVDHIYELGNELPTDMVVFNKPNSAITSTLTSFDKEAIHYESEICFVVENGYFTAVGFGLDLTKRKLQSELKAKGLPWERAKAFDGSVLLSDFVSITPNSINEVSINLFVNKELRQQSKANYMIYKPESILKGIQEFMTLENGDVVMTGTPKGVGEIKAGEIFYGVILLNNTPIVEATWTAK